MRTLVSGTYFLEGGLQLELQIFDGNGVWPLSPRGPGFTGRREIDVVDVAHQSLAGEDGHSEVRVPLDTFDRVDTGHFQ